MKQYIPKYMELPELGSVRELIGKDGNLVALGVVYGHLPKQHSVLIKIISLDDNGCVTRRLHENKC